MTFQINIDIPFQLKIVVGNYPDSSIYEFLIWCFNRIRKEFKDLDDIVHIKPSDCNTVLTISKPNIHTIKQETIREIIEKFKSNMFINKHYLGISVDVPLYMKVDNNEIYNLK